jgi:hypothetical protein
MEFSLKSKRHQPTEVYVRFLEFQSLEGGKAEEVEGEKVNPLLSSTDKIPREK